MLGSGSFKAPLVSHSHPHTCAAGKSSSADSSDGGGSRHSLLLCARLRAKGTLLLLNKGTSLENHEGSSTKASRKGGALE